MKYLLDTHVFLWTMTADRRIASVEEELIDPSNEVYVSAASLWEIEIKNAKGKLTISETEALKALSQQSFLELPVSMSQIRYLKTLCQAPDMPVHKDPFDNLLVAQAKAEGMVFLTADKSLNNYREPCIRNIIQSEE